MITNVHKNFKNEKFIIYKKFDVFKACSIKLFDLKLKYWLDDFYTGGKDTLCQDSLILTRCSIINKNQFTNFF